MAISYSYVSRSFAFGSLGSLRSQYKVSRSRYPSQLLRSQSKISLFPARYCSLLVWSQYKVSMLPTRADSHLLQCHYNSLLFRSQYPSSLFCSLSRVDSLPLLNAKMFHTSSLPVGSSVNPTLKRKDYRYGFGVWCRRKYSEGDEDEDFTFPSPPSFSGTPTPLCKKEEGTSPEEGGSPSWKEEGEDTCEIKNDSSTPEGDKAGHELSFNGWLSSLGGPSNEVEGSPSSSLKRKGEEEGTSEAPGTSKASISPKKSQSPFSDSQMKELIEKLNRHREATPPRQVRGNRPPIPEPSSIHTAGTSSRAQPVRDNQPPVPEPSKNWWESLLCLCRGSKAKENTPSGNEGNGQDTGSGENDPGAGE